MLRVGFTCPMSYSKLGRSDSEILQILPQKRVWLLFQACMCPQAIQKHRGMIQPVTYEVLKPSFCVLDAVQNRGDLSTPKSLSACFKYFFVRSR